VLYFMVGERDSNPRPRYYECGAPEVSLSFFNNLRRGARCNAVADLVDRILRAKYGEADPSVDKAWQDETRRRIAEIENGRVQGIPLDETLAKARKITGQ
jgi:hypothetical protein